MNCANAEEDGNATAETVMLPRLAFFLFKLENTYMIHPVGHIC
jgi:hypothetical protein